MLSCEVLIDPKMANRGKLMLEAMMEASPVPLKVRTEYRGDCDWLMVYGTGHPKRRPWQQAHMKAGGHLIGWDLGYWKRREGDDFRMRLTIDADHPQQRMRSIEPPDRWDRDGIELRNDYQERGHVVIVGMSAKAEKIHKMSRLRWETNQMRAVKAHHPKLKIWFRPKRDTDPVLPAVRTAREPDIADVLRGASFVVCRHSNVAIDACIAGVPVVCEDGAAAFLYGNDIKAPFNPTPEQRLQFLRSLAWWQYSPTEAEQAWLYITQHLCA